MQDDLVFQAEAGGEDDLAGDLLAQAGNALGGRQPREHLRQCRGFGSEFVGVDVRARCMRCGRELAGAGLMSSCRSGSAP